MKKRTLIAAIVIAVAVIGGGVYKFTKGDDKKPQEV